MSNLVGTGLNQAPTNSMLGGLAYQDPAHASIKDLDLKNLSQINSETADTAVDVFVYDTSKDSDGGAWRKRTTHTSWYNETLNTATRGSRREFPAVAVIVAENTSITIYDGDDPDLPMWMVFNTVNGMIFTNSNNLERVVMMNGVLVWSSFRAGIISFIPESAELLEAGYAYGLRYGIVNRNTSGGWITVTGRQIISSNTNDVAITVLPNAPIDDATGLPTPTIAVATDGGASIIKDDGNIVGLYTNDVYDKYTSIDFGDNGRVYYTPENTAVYYSTSIPPINLNQTAYNSTNASRVMFPSMDHGGFLYTNTTFPVRTLALNGTIGTKIIGGKAVASRDASYEPPSHTKRQGLTLIDEGASNPTSSVAYISSSYNTGWMHGNIKGAFLSDTTAESLTANTNLASACIQDGTARLTSETYTNGATSWQMVDDAGSSNGYVVVAFKGLTIGQSYFVSMTWDNNAALDSGYEHHVSHKNGLAGENHTQFTHWNKTNGSSETLTGIFTAQSTDTDDLVIYANAITLNVSNFNIRQVDDEDRSYSNKGLGVYGTITKSAVATDTDLVAYGPFSASNFLRQPYNSDLNFETDDFSIMFWMYNTGTNSHQTLVSRDNREFSVDILDNSNYDRKFRIYAYDSSNSMGSFDSNADPFQLNTWSHVCVNYTSGNTVSIYVNGVLNKSGTLNYDIDDTSHGLNIGARNTSGTYAYAADGTKLALVRISKSAPSGEKIKKFYEDEKVLFQENAKCTFYGSSDPVTALGYDEENDTLHVGTSSGRSEFQGLARINNTTTAVTTAISASDELIAEQ